MGTGALTPEVKQLGSEAKHSPTSNAEIRMSGSIPPLPRCISVVWCLLTSQGQLYFYLGRPMSLPYGYNFRYSTVIHLLYTQITAGREELVANIFNLCFVLFFSSEVNNALHFRRLFCF